MSNDKVAFEYLSDIQKAQLRALRPELRKVKEAHSYLGTTASLVPMKQYISNSVTGQGPIAKMTRAKKPISLRINSFVVWEYLTKQNLAQSELAKRLEISSCYMSQLISGSRSPSPKLRRKMLEVLSPLSFGEIFLISKRGQLENPV